jgi:PilZ domain
MVNTTRRKYQRFQVKIPILVNGVDKVGCAFRLAAETLNGSIDGLGLLLAKEPGPSSSLLISIPDNEQLIQIQTDICHVTTLDTNQMLVGVRFRGIHHSLTAPSNSD